MTEQTEPENWQASILAAAAKIGEAIESGERGQAQRAMEIVTQLLAEAEIADAAAKDWTP